MSSLDCSLVLQGELVLVLVLVLEGEQLITKAKAPITRAHSTLRA